MTSRQTRTEVLFKLLFKLAFMERSNWQRLATHRIFQSKKVSFLFPTQFLYRLLGDGAAGSCENNIMGYSM